MKIIKFLLNFKFAKYAFGISLYIILLCFFLFLNKLFPENNTLEWIKNFIGFIGLAFVFLYLFYLMKKTADKEDEENEKKGAKGGTNPIAWFFKPGKYERKLLAKQKRNAKARASFRSVSGLTKSGKLKSAKQVAADFRKFGKKK